jgi:hypothetical protein
MCPLNASTHPDLPRPGRGRRAADKKKAATAKGRAALIDSQFWSVLVLYQISVTLSMLFARRVPHPDTT